LTRTLRRDGKYWFELENRAATKQEVKRLLSKFGVDPDNMLVIMHQNMVEMFTVLSNRIGEMLWMPRKSSVGY
jgi:chromosome segregation protein